MPRGALRDRGLPPSAYREYMRSPAWAATKAKWRDLRPRRRRCEVCGDRHYDLHHRTYVRLGRERLRDLVPLCQRHHDAVHRLQDRMRWGVERATTVYLGFRRLWPVLALLVAVAIFIFTL